VVSGAEAPLALRGGLSPGPLQAAAGARSPLLQELIISSLRQPCSGPRSASGGWRLAAASSLPLARAVSTVRRPAALLGEREARYWAKGRRLRCSPAAPLAELSRAEQAAAGLLPIAPAVAIAKPLHNAPIRSESGGEEGCTIKVIALLYSFCSLSLRPA